MPVSVGETNFGGDTRIYVVVEVVSLVPFFLPNL